MLPGNFNAAAALVCGDERRAREAHLICPDCGEQNRPGASQLLELGANGVALCNVCNCKWTVNPRKD